MITALLLAVVMIPLWAYAPTTGLLVLGAFLMQFMVQGAWGVIPAHITELSPDSVRGFLPGFAYQCGVLLASSVAYVETVFAERMTYAQAMALTAVTVFTLGAIVAYGLWKTRGPSSMTDYVHGGYRDRWLTNGLGVMATQASAITFLSMPGQAYEDGLRFVQFYFGLPVAMVILSIAFIPRFYRARVLTAYELLETRFDLKTRQLAALLFLLQRGLSAGITIYAPAIVLSKVLGWPLNATCLVIGAVVIKQPDRSRP